MEFIGIIFYVIIFAVIASAKRAAQSNGEKTSKKKAWMDSPTKGNMTGNTMSSKGMEKPNMLSKGMAKPNMSSKGALNPNVLSKGKTAIPNVPNKKRQAPVFMEPHREESFQPKIRNNNLWGEDEHASQRIVALRLMEGDPVPEGYTRIKCPYCAADNLVTKHCKQYHSCYFCRVPID